MRALPSLCNVVRIASRAFFAFSIGGVAAMGYRQELFESHGENPERTQKSRPKAAFAEPEPALSKL